MIVDRNQVSGELIDQRLTQLHAKPGENWSTGEIDFYLDWIIKCKLRYLVVVVAWRCLDKLIATQEDAEDAVSDFLERVLVGVLRVYDPKKGKLWSLITSRLRLHCRSFKRTLRRDHRIIISSAPAVNHPPKDMEPEIEFPDESIRFEEALITKDLIQSAIQSLQPRRRFVILKYYFEDRPIRDIADCLGVSQGAVRLLLLRGRQDLERHLSCPSTPEVTGKDRVSTR